ncbi:hypothetical protein P4133_01940 [Pseudomonas aeruginosa]|nr:hypothetical protein [Pseudomonas aeruginosa]
MVLSASWASKPEAVNEPAAALAGRVGAPGRVLRRQRSDSLDQLQLALVRLDADGCMSQLNLGWEALTGYRAGVSAAQSCAVSPYRGPAAVVAGAAGAARQPCGAAFVQVLRYLTRAGELRWVEARVRRQGSGFIASLGDISSQMLTASIAAGAPPQQATCSMACR